MQSSSTPSTIGIVTAFEQEFDAVVSCLQLTQSLNCPGSFPYLTGDLFGYKLVVTKCYKQGSVHSALATYELIRDCQPILVALLGIAGGLEKGFKVGDVVIPHSIWAYEYGKTIGERTAPEPRPYELLSTELQLIADRMQGSDAIAKTDVMASGCKVVASSQFHDSLRQAHRKICSIEMESEGVAVAARRCGTPVIVIKGISDFADETTKGKILKRTIKRLPDTWRLMGQPARDRTVTEKEERKHQVLAARNAANTFRALLERADFQKLYPPNKPEFQPRVHVPEVSAGATDEQLIRATAKDASVRIGNVDLQSQFFPRELWDEQVDRASSRNLFVDNSEQPNRIIIHLDELKRLPPKRVADLKEQMLIEARSPNSLPSESAKIKRVLRRMEQGSSPYPRLAGLPQIKTTGDSQARCLVVPLAPSTFAITDIQQANISVPAALHLRQHYHLNSLAVRCALVHGNPKSKMIEFHRRSQKNSAYMEAWDVGAAGFVDPNVHRDPEDDDRISAWWAAANELHEELNIDLDALPSRERYYFFGIGRIKSVGGVDILGYCDATDKVIPDIRAVRSARVSEFARCKAEPEVVAQFVLEKRHWVPTALVTLVLTLEHLGFPRVRIAHAFRILESRLLLEPGAE